MTHALFQSAGQAEEGGNDPRTIIKVRGKQREVIRRDKEKKLKLLHYDFYRFEKPEQELVESLEEGITHENVTVIEWAERVEKHLPKNTIKVTFHYVSENEREIEIDFPPSCHSSGGGNPFL